MEIKDLLISSKNDIREIVREVIDEKLNDVHPKSTPDKLYNQKQGAEFLGIAPVTLSRWTKDGYVQGMEKGRQKRYKESELLKAFKDTQSRKYRRK